MSLWSLICSGNGWNSPTACLNCWCGSMTVSSALFACCSARHSPTPSVPTLWIIGGMRAGEPFNGSQHTIYSGRRAILRERAD
ncbi:hypothetical protein RISK_005355 [Rhodopirellula islandica]|uniref:Uncharacterized protein n=1 Tax=Rhodopirellula islandica TaxID=595434 RepID=A0A0J1E9Z0_RHOIS|nr:hypothetical protein RISK_005355 [Rhodopirellula islandica]